MKNKIRQDTLLYDDYDDDDDTWVRRNANDNNKLILQMIYLNNQIMLIQRM